MKKHLAFALSTLPTLCGCPDGGGPGPGGTGDMAMAPGPGPAWIQFSTETVDAAASGAGVALAVDGAGAPHVFYFSGGAEMTCMLGGTATKYRPGELWHATRAGDGAFSRRKISGTDAEVAGLAALVDPRTGRPVVAYQGGQKGSLFCGGSDMMLARFDGAGWRETRVADSSTAGTGAVETSGDVVGRWPALAISSSGTWYLAWQDIHFGFYMNDDTRKADLEFASGNDGMLRTGESVQADGAGIRTTIALDRMERPVLAYSNYRTGGVAVALRTAPGTWRVTPVVAGGEIGPALAAARDGRLGLAYYDPDLRLLRLRESDDATAWGPPDVVDRDGDVGRVVSLRYDSKGRPVLAYYSCGRYGAQSCDPATDQLRVARREGEVWQTAAVDDGGEGACGEALALWLTSDDRIHVAYQCTTFDHGSGQFKAQVKYARER